jgi:hypothetical protein
MEGFFTGTDALPDRNHYHGHAANPTSPPALTAKGVIAQMVEESRQQGIQSSNKMIISRLNELGIRPARGGTWTTSAVDSIKRRMKL